MKIFLLFLLCISITKPKSEGHVGKLAFSFHAAANYYHTRNLRA